MELYRQLAVVVGPVFITGILGPILLLMMSKAKSKAETENYEVLSDKARFEAMDLLVNHLRQEIERLKADVTSERTTSAAGRKRIAELENLTVGSDRISADVGDLAVVLNELLAKAGLPVPERQAKIEVFMSTLNSPTMVVEVPEEDPKNGPAK